MPFGTHLESISMGAPPSEDYSYTIMLAQLDTKTDLPTPAKKAFPSSSGSMFAEYFSESRPESFKKADLIDARARRLFETTSLACSLDAYPFQAPLSSRTGPVVELDGHRMLMLSSYDYLGLIGDARIDEAAIAAVRKYGTATGGARLLTGTLDLHHQMEQALAEFKGTETVLTCTSGYMANLAVISALFGPADRVIADIYSHRSLIDAFRLAGVQVQRFQHNDMASLRFEIENGPEANRTLIVSDGVFSMAGYIATLQQICDLAEKYSAMVMVDDSHSVGFLGKNGRGTHEYCNVVAGRHHYGNAGQSARGRQWWLHQRPQGSGCAPAPTLPAVSVFKLGRASHCRRFTPGSPVDQRNR